MVAVSPAVSVDLLLLMAMVGGVVSGAVPVVKSYVVIPA